MLLLGIALGMVLSELLYLLVERLSGSGSLRARLTSVLRRLVLDRRRGGGAA